ncbi:MAG: NosD domain-containing protein, partial [Candidatus Bathyarchaeota archaeon]
ADNKVGVTFSGSTTTDNLFYNNSFDNNQNVQITSTNYTEAWDNGTIGNYWSNYNGTDNNGDGTGDTPYIIDENNQDNYPLMEPAEIPEFPSLAPLLTVPLLFTVALVTYRRKQSRRNFV